MTHVIAGILSLETPFEELAEMSNMNKKKLNNRNFIENIQVVNFVMIKCFLLARRSSLMKTTQRSLYIHVTYQPITLMALQHYSSQ